MVPQRRKNSTRTLATGSECSKGATGIIDPRIILCFRWGCTEKNTRFRMVQRLQNSTSAVATGSECSNREWRSLPVRTLDLGWSSDAKTPQAQSLLVASSSVCFFLTGWVSTKSVDKGVQKTFQSISIFNHPIHLNFGLHSSGAVSHYHATKGSVICLQLLGLCLSSFFDNLQLVLIPLGVSWAYLPSPAVSTIQLVSCRMLESVLGVLHSPVVL